MSIYKMLTCSLSSLAYTMSHGANTLLCQDKEVFNLREKNFKRSNLLNQTTSKSLIHIIPYVFTNNFLLIPHYTQVKKS